MSCRPSGLQTRRTLSPRDILQRVPRKIAMLKTSAQHLRLALAAWAIVSAVPSSVRAQWAPYPWKNVPRTPDGKVDLTAPARRTADGHPDLSGFWVPTVAVKHLLNLAADLKPGEVPL